MTDTSKDVERLIADCHFSAFETGQSLYTSCAETISALAAQLEAANARADRARDDALGEAAGCIGHITRHEDLDAIFALRYQPTPTASVEPVTAPTTSQIMADPRVQALVDALEWYKKNMMMPSSQPAVEALAQLKEPT